MDAALGDGMGRRSRSRRYRPRRAPPENAPQQHPLNNLVVTDLLAAAAEDREPLCSGHGARWSLEMILSVYEAHRTGARVPLPLADRTHPLTRW